MSVAFMVNGNQWALIDDEDAPIVLDRGISWLAYTNKSGGNTYVRAFGWGRGRRMLYLHRYIIAAPSGSVVDHVNGNGLDNRRANLRLTDARGNGANTRKMAGTSSRFKGVYYDRDRGRWVAQIRPIENGRQYLGSFDDEELAARAYDSAARAQYGEFARLNFPEAVA